MRGGITKVLLLSLTIPLMLAGCSSIGVSKFSRTDPKRGLVNQTYETREAGAAPNAEVMIRIIKEDRILELWKVQKDATWQKIKTYNICTVSGGLGPKKKQGDRQAPEGFYSVAGSQLNPFSAEHLSINTGYPNVRDRFYRYTGSALMIHGGCSSAGCYAITDAAMEELYAAVRDAIRGGQKNVQLQIYPFVMSDWRMMLQSKDPNYAFWKELKQGWDWFEKNQKPIPVTVVNGSYKIN